MNDSEITISLAYRIPRSPDSKAVKTAASGSQGVTETRLVEKTVVTLIRP